MTDPHRLSAVAAAEQIAKKQLTSVALVEDCLARIAAREPLVGAWEVLDRAAVLAAARRADQSAAKSPLHGLPIAIKDIIDTADLPTAYGSPIYAGHRPKADALCVARLRAAGAIVMGKTVTTEFAYFTPGKTANPHNLAHTPGGSSSGSAAAVADYMVPLSIGTQTAGSVIRPAAFCGVVGYKGTKDWIRMTGIIPFSPSLDTLGVFARSVADAALFRGVLIDDTAPVASSARPPRIGLCRTPQWGEASGALQAVLEEAAQRLAKAGATLRDVDAPWQGDGLIEAQKAILTAEAVTSFAKEARDHGDKLSRRLSDLLEAGKKIDRATIEKAQALALKCQKAHDALFGDVDVLLTPAAPGEAPKGLAATGDPVFNRGWTYIGAPCVSLPYGKGPAGLPLAIQLVGKRGADRELLAASAWIEHAAMTTIRWGIIGCGDVTEVKSGPGFYKATNSALVAVMRRNGALAADYASRHNVARWHDDADAILHAADIDAVYIATHPDTHASYTLRAAAAGKTVYAEKPMARSHDECQAMVAACRKAGVKLYVGYYRRALPYFLKVRDLLADGAIGAVRIVTTRQFARLPPAEQLAGGKLPWRVDPQRNGGGFFVDMGCHTLDILDFLFGPIASVQGTATNRAGAYVAEDTVTATYNFASGVAGAGLWCFAADFYDDVTEIVGETGRIRFSSFTFMPIELIRGDAKQTFPIATPPHVHQPLIQSIVDELNGTGVCPSTGDSGARTAWVMDEILGPFRAAQRAAGLWPAAAD